MLCPVGRKSHQGRKIFRERLAEIQTETALKHHFVLDFPDIVFLFGLVLCNVCFFDLRDRVDDARAGIHTVPVILGVAGTRRLCLTLCLGVALAAAVAGAGLRVPLITAALTTAAYARLLPARSGRLKYALAVDGVPVLLGLCVLEF